MCLRYSPVLASGSTAGDITVSVVTNDWVETIKCEDDVAELERLYVLASQAKSRRP